MIMIFSSHGLFAVTIMAFLICFSFNGVSGFVNVASVTRQTLQSTSTSNTYEPTHLLTDFYQRNPFADEKKDVTANETSRAKLSVDLDIGMPSVEVSAATASIALAPTWFSQIADNLGHIDTSTQARAWLFSRYIQAELRRRRLRKDVRVQLHNFLRDSGLLRSIMDFLATIGAPSLAMDRPEIIPRFLHLAQNCIHIPYGPHRMQGIDMYLPETKQPRGLMFFVVSH
jgi:hypothetical protein